RLARPSTSPRDRIVRMFRAPGPSPARAGARPAPADARQNTVRPETAGGRALSEEVPLRSPWPPAEFEGRSGPSAAADPPRPPPAAGASGNCLDSNPTDPSTEAR